MFHSSATGRRREQTLPEAPAFVKRCTAGMTLRGIDDILTGLSAEPACLLDAVDRAAALLG